MDDLVIALAIFIAVHCGINRDLLSDPFHHQDNAVDADADADRRRTGNDARHRTGAAPTAQSSDTTGHCATYTARRG